MAFTISYIEVFAPGYSYHEDKYNLGDVLPKAVRFVFEKEEFVPGEGYISNVEEKEVRTQLTYSGVFLKRIAWNIEGLNGLEVRALVKKLQEIFAGIQFSRKDLPICLTLYGYDKEDPNQLYYEFGSLWVLVEPRGKGFRT
jgi:hypothetical protein